MKTSLKLLIASVFLSTGIFAQTTNTLPATGNVGLGTPAPATKLQVCGKAVFDSVTVVKDTLRVMGESRLKDVLIDGNAVITGDANISGDVNLGSKVSFSNSNYAMKFTSGSPSIMDYAPAGSVPPGPSTFCQGTLANIPTINRFAGFIQSWAPSVSQLGTNDILTMGFDGSNGRIELETGISYPVNSGPVLRLNYFCGKDVAICTGPNGGYTSTGQFFEIGNPTRTNTTAANIKANGVTGIYIDNTFSSDFLSAQTNRVNRYQTQAFTVLNSTSGTDLETFTVNGDGYTRIIKPAASAAPTSFLIGINNSGTVQNVFYVQKDGETTISMPPSIHDNALNVVDQTNNTLNFRVKRNGYVWARRFEVTMNNFPDYVFTKEYKRKSLYEVEKYIKENGHLENMPTAEEVEQNGADLGEISRVNVEKTEEIFLYLVEMKKELDEVKKENQALKEKVLKLEKQ